MSDEQLFRVLDMLFDQHGPDVIPIGRLPAHCLAHWPGRATDDIVVTRGRRNHYLANHPEMHKFENAMIRGLLNPDELHLNKSDSDIAIAYSQVSDTRWVRTAIIVSHQAGLQNSVVSCRLARMKEVVEGRKADRQIWRKQ